MTQKTLLTGLFVLIQTFNSGLKHRAHISGTNRSDLMESLNATLGKLGDSDSCADSASSGSEGDLLEVLLLKHNIQRYHLVSFEASQGLRINRNTKMCTNLEKSDNTTQQVRSGALGVNEDLILLVTLLGHNNLVIAIHGRAGGTGQRQLAIKLILLQPTHKHTSSSAALRRLRVLIELHQWSRFEQLIDTQAADSQPTVIVSLCKSVFSLF